MRSPIACEWEFTRACNLRCPHCSAGAGDRDALELSSEKALQIVDDIVALGCRLVSLTGGEPLLRPDWEAIAEKLNSRKVHVSLMSNGWLIDRDMADRIRGAGVAEVVISIDGIGAMHDRIRARTGAYDRASHAISQLQEAGVSVAITTTVFRQTLKELPSIHQMAAERGIKKWHLLAGKRPERGVRGRMACEWLRSQDLRSLVPMLGRLHGMGGVQVVMGDNLGSESRSCEAGIGMFAIDAIGQVKGCASMPSRAPFVEGSVAETQLSSIWHNAKAFRYNRDFSVQQLAGACRTCNKAEKCRGGCYWSRDFDLGSAGNRFCYVRESSDGIHRLRLGTAVAVGLGVVMTGCAGAAKASPDYPPSQASAFHCGMERELAEPTTEECRALKKDLEVAAMRCCYSRMIVPLNRRDDCGVKAEVYVKNCGK